jgi:hypothetical protein
MEVAEWYKKATRRRVTDWREIISELTITYKTLLNNGEWPAATNRKEDVAKTIQGLFSKMENKLDSKIENKIMHKLQQGNGGRNRNTGGGGNQSETRTCHHCGKVGHIKPNCPELKPAAKANSNTDHSNQQTTATSTLPGKKRYEAPAYNESHTNKIGQDSWKWCAKCKRWNKGNSAHLTDEHRAKNANSGGATIPKTTVEGGLAATRTGGGILRQSMSGWLAKTHQPVHKDDVSWCSTCNCWVQSIESHSHGIAERAPQQLKDQAGQR